METVGKWGKDRDEDYVTNGSRGTYLFIYIRETSLQTHVEIDHRTPQKIRPPLVD